MDADMEMELGFGIIMGVEMGMDGEQEKEMGMRGEKTMEIQMGVGVEGESGMKKKMGVNLDGVSTVHKKIYSPEYGYENGDSRSDKNKGKYKDGYGYGYLDSLDNETGIGNGSGHHGDDKFLFGSKNRIGAGLLDGSGDGSGEGNGSGAKSENGNGMGEKGFLIMDKFHYRSSLMEEYDYAFLFALFHGLKDEIAPGYGSLDENGYGCEYGDYGTNIPNHDEEYSGYGYGCGYPYDKPGFEFIGNENGWGKEYIHDEPHVDILPIEELAYLTLEDQGDSTFRIIYEGKCSGYGDGRERERWYPYDKPKSEDKLTYVILENESESTYLIMEE